MARELERKFICVLTPDRWAEVDLIAKLQVEISQGYLTPPDARTEVRLRKGRELSQESADRPVPASRMDPEGPRKPYILTVKVDVGDSVEAMLNRPEYEINLKPEELEELWPLTEGRRLKKVRTSYTLRSPTIEIAAFCVDSFRDHLEGLTLAEIEFDNQEAAHRFVPFDMLGAEVTGDPRFRNSKLASADGPPTWSHERDKEH